MARQKGVALMAVLLIFAVLAALAVRMSGNHALLIAQSRHQFEGDLALNYALGAEELARQALFDDFTSTGKDVDHLDEVWAQPLPPFEVDEGGYIEVQVSELNGCFNLNTLVDGAADAAAATEMLRRLVQQLGLPPQTADLVRDWVDSDDQWTNPSAEDSEYLLKEPAYRAANQQMMHKSEIQLLDQLDEEQKAVLAANTCVVPDHYSLAFNVNTAPIALLVALKPDVTPDSLGGLDNPDGANRQYAEVSEFINEYAGVMEGTDQYLRVTSDYFRIDVHAQVGQAVTILSALAHRDPDNGLVTIRQRDFGRDFSSRVALQATEVEGI